jgi:hypothetical protein
MSPRDANESKLFFHLLFSSIFPAKSKAVFIVVAAFQNENEMSPKHLSSVMEVT